MSEQDKIVAIDAAGLERWLEGSGSVAELMAELPFLRTETEARRYIEDIREGLEDLRHGRFVSHEQIVRDAEERRRRYRASAAE